MIPIPEVMTSLARDNIAFRSEKNDDVSLALCNMANLLEINLKMFLCHPRGIAVSF